MKLSAADITRLKNSPRPETPGDVLFAQLEKSNITVKAMAGQIQVPVDDLNRLLSNKDRLTPDLAFRIGKFWGPSGQYWLELQVMVDWWDLFSLELWEEAGLGAVL